MYLFEALPSTSFRSGSPESLPLILLLHGFPELAYSWRKVLAPLSEARGGYHVVAPDLRGYGRTQQGPGDRPTRQIRYDDPLAPFHVLNIVEDICALVHALGHKSVAMLVGHDFGSPVAGHCVLARPALFESVVFMSAPFAGVERPPIQRDGSGAAADNAADADKPPPALVHAVATALAALTPPRKHYTAYFSTPDANREMLGARPEDLHSFVGGYYHMKSGAWEGNTAHPLLSASDPAPTIAGLARDLAALPEYYVMPLGEDMRQVVARHARQDPRFTWPQDDENDGADADAGAVYASTFARTGFQGGLNYYRCALAPPPAERVDELVALSDLRVSVPAAFIAGARDWGVYQTPGAVEKMRRLCGMESEDLVLIEGAGHWVQQEAPERVIAELLRFLGKVERRLERVN
jgi:pimeloyl-ACP methyl ester carboxylesterase